MRTPVVFLFVVPALLSLLLGPAVGGGNAFPGRSVVGFAVLFSFMTISYTGLALFREFSAGTWLRQATHRPSRTAFIAGKSLPVLAAGLLQLTVFAVLAFLLHPLPLHGNIAQLFVAAVPLACCGPLIGVLGYNLTGSVSSFQSVAYLVMMGMGVVGGTIVPSSRLPEPTRLLGPATPHYWAMRAFTESTVGGGGWGEPTRAAVVMTAMMLTLGAVAYATFDYRREKVAI